MKTPEGKEREITLVQSALTDDFGIRAENVARISEKGDNSEAFSADYNGQRIIIKTIDTVDNDYGMYPVETTSLELLRKHGIPVATPLGYREKAKYLEQPMIVQTAVSGIPLYRSERARDPKLYTAIGEMLNKIHQIKLEGFGKLEVKDGKLRGQSSSWKQSLLDYNPNGVSYTDVAYLMDHGFIDAGEARKIENAFTQVLEVDLPQASFLHNDIQSTHIFTDGEKITGLIDMGGASAGDPRFDLAKTRFYFPKELWPAFAQGYGELAQDPLVDKYLLLATARKVIYRHKKNFPERIPEALEALKQSLAETK